MKTAHSTSKKIVSASGRSVWVDIRSPFAREFFKQTILIDQSEPFINQERELARLDKLVKRKAPQTEIEECLSWLHYYQDQIKGNPMLEERDKLDPKTKKLLDRRQLEREGWIFDSTDLERFFRGIDKEKYAEFRAMALHNRMLRKFGVIKGSEEGYHLTDFLKVGDDELRRFIRTKGTGIEFRLKLVIQNEIRRLGFGHLID